MISRRKKTPTNATAMLVERRAEVPEREAPTRRTRWGVMAVPRMTTMGSLSVSSGPRAAVCAHSPCFKWPWADTLRAAAAESRSPGSHENLLRAVQPICAPSLDSPMSSAAVMPPALNWTMSSGIV
ncbi:hypothetical protein [Streptomyces globisporus]|uniref:hypothetical protein n=1 Tax=Streptomyces globisporus TaxID=1908 RepID=UPI001F436CF4|nr:hypothetical protein [Streptomyces globisporus]